MDFPLDTRNEPPNRAFRAGNTQSFRQPVEPLLLRDASRKGRPNRPGEHDGNRERTSARGRGGPHEARNAILGSREDCLEEETAPYGRGEEKPETGLARKRDRFDRARFRTLDAALETVVRTGDYRFRVVFIPIEYALRANFVALFVSDAGIIINSWIVSGRHADLGAHWVPQGKPPVFRDC